MKHNFLFTSEHSQGFFLCALLCAFSFVSCRTSRQTVSSTSFLEVYDTLSVSEFELPDTIMHHLPSQRVHVVSDSVVRDSLDKLHLDTLTAAVGIASASAWVDEGGHLNLILSQPDTTLAVPTFGKYRQFNFSRITHSGESQNVSKSVERGFPISYLVIGVLSLLAAAVSLSYIRFHSSS